MKLSDPGVKVIEEREGLRTTAYKDSVGVWTIGIGHTSAAGPPTVYQGMTITRDEAWEIFKRDVVQYENAVLKSVKVGMTQYSFDSWTSWCYNIGTGGFSGSTAVKRMNAGDFDGAADAMLMWNKPPEIISRRQGEYVQFKFGRYEARCNPLTAADKAPIGPPPEPGEPPVAAKPTLKRGDKGPDVREMQELVRGKLERLLLECTADGDFGYRTEDALKATQAAFGVTADGICGPITWDKLLEGST